MSLDIQLIQLSSPSSTLVRDLHLNVPRGVIHTVMGATAASASRVCGGPLRYTW